MTPIELSHRLRDAHGPDLATLAIGKALAEYFGDLSENLPEPLALLVREIERRERTDAVSDPVERLP